MHSTASSRSTPHCTGRRRCRRVLDPLEVWHHDATGQREHQWRPGTDPHAFMTNSQTLVLAARRAAFRCKGTTSRSAAALASGPYRQFAIDNLLPDEPADPHQTLSTRRSSSRVTTSRLWRELS